MRIALLAGLVFAIAAGDSLGSGSRPRLFHVVKEDGKFWLAAPDGNKFFSMAVNVVKSDDWSPKEGSPMYRGGEIRGGFENWVRFTSRRLRDWGFNTVGSWSNREMEQQGIPYCATLHIAPWDPHRLIDVWSRKYEEHLKTEVVKQIGNRSPHDPLLIGYFVCNELPWYGEFGWPSGSKSLLEKYRELPRLAPGRRVAERFADGEDEEFAGEVATRFMKIAVRAVRRHDPNHLILGCRIAGGAPAPVIRAIGRASDVFSMNWYVKNGRPDPRYIDRVYLLAKKPVMITEFSYRATENRGSLGNSKGADVTVPTQAERARRYRQYVESLAVLPQVVGFHWFMYFDQPTLGRFDGEDCNYGIVDHADEPYEPLVAAMRDMNVRAAELHRDSVLDLPKTGDEDRPRLKLPVRGAGTRFGGFEHGISRPVNVWGDAAGGFKGSFEIAGANGVFTFSSGTGWGGGVGLRRTDGPIDLSGAAKAVVRVKAPVGIRFRFVINEDGVAEPGAASYAGVRGADGEQYSSPELTGSGDMQTYTVELADFNKSGSYGNQNGNDTLDMPAVKYVEFALPGGQGEGVMEVAPVGFE